MGIGGAAIKKVLILYFSGAGATKKIAGIINMNLQERYNTTMCTVEKAKDLSLERFDAYVVGTPVYHAAPSALLMEFIEGMQPLKRVAPAFIYNSRATWSCNTNRILAKKLREKNIVTILDRDYRSPASDGTIIVPAIKRFHQFDKRILAKVQADCSLFAHKLERTGKFEGYLPHFRLSGILNAPNKMAGQFVTFKIHLHGEQCRRCGSCIKNCPHNAYEESPDGYPVFVRERCENCYRCIHHCGAKALSLHKRRRVKKQLYSGDKK